MARAGLTNWPIFCIVAFRRKVFHMHWDLFASKIPWLTGNTRITKSQFVFKQKQKQRLFEFTTSCFNHDKNAAIFPFTDIVELKNASSLNQECGSSLSLLILSTTSAFVSVNLCFRLFLFLVRTLLPVNDFLYLYLEYYWSTHKVKKSTNGKLFGLIQTPLWMVT